MTNVISSPVRKASHTASPTAIAILPALGNIERKQALENVLSMALYHVRNGNTQQVLHATMVKAVWAAPMLEQASNEASISGRA